MRISDWSSDVCSADARQSRPDGDPRQHQRHRARLAEEHRLGQAGAARLGELDERLHRREQPHGKQPEAKPGEDALWRSEEHTSELQSLMRNSYAVFCLKKKNLALNTTK